MCIAYKAFHALLMINKKMISGEQSIYSPVNKHTGANAKPLQSYYKYAFIKLTASETV
jgi:hypothetical protein